MKSSHYILLMVFFILELPTKAFSVDDLYSSDSKVRITTLKDLAKANSAKQALNNMESIEARYSFGGSDKIDKMFPDPEVPTEQTEKITSEYYSQVKKREKQLELHKPTEAEIAQVTQTIVLLGKKFDQIYDHLFSLEVDVDNERIVFLPEGFHQAFMTLSKQYQSKNLELLNSPSPVVRGIAVYVLLYNDQESYREKVVIAIMSLLVGIDDSFPANTLNRVTNPGGFDYLLNGGVDLTSVLVTHYIFPNAWVFLEASEIAINGLFEDVVEELNQSETFEYFSVNSPENLAMVFKFMARIISLIKNHPDLDYDDTVFINDNIKFLNEKYAAIHSLLSQKFPSDVEGQQFDTQLLSSLQLARHGKRPKFDYLQAAESRSERLILFNKMHAPMVIQANEVRRILEFLSDFDSKEKEDFIKNLSRQLEPRALVEIRNYLRESEEDHEGLFRNLGGCSKFFEGK